MTPAVTSARRIPVTAVIIATFSLIALAAGLYYLSRPAPSLPDPASASSDAKAYLPNLELSEVTMQATENFMQQQVVEVQGKIANHGSRKLAIVEVYCLFSAQNGGEIHRERIAIARALEPRDTRAFRLPFDNLPDGWNQAMPRLVIANISFAKE